MQAPTGLMFAPTLESGQAMAPADFQKLPEAERQRLEAEIAALQKEAQEIFRQMPRWEKERRERVKRLNREAAGFAAGHLISQLRSEYANLPEVSAFFDAVQQNIVENVQEILGNPEDPQSGLRRGAALRRYQINLLVDNSAPRRRTRRLRGQSHLPQPGRPR